MVKVQMLVVGRAALVDSDMVKFMTKKNELVAGATRLQSVMNAVPSEAEPILQKQLQEMITKIRNLNRRIRENVVFL